MDVATSPAYFTVQNTLTDEEMWLFLEPAFAYETAEPWTVNIVPDSLIMMGDDCPQTIEVLLEPPPGAYPGETQMVHVTVFGEVWGSRQLELGGVSVIATAGAPFMIGDLNCDGEIGFGDINPFVVALTHTPGTPWEYDCSWLAADCNQDFVVDFRDINAFVLLLTGD
jgi:hypothetical protein